MMWRVNFRSLLCILGALVARVSLHAASLLVLSDSAALMRGADSLGAVSGTLDPNQARDEPRWIRASVG